ncbi:hypothetical protein [Streptantibioticus cattleyicolor]|uniref:Uncharacterized protein n=1 Tax=Streptantibioticus cattleyicolor (strain ATCC 35852 / DSM 46488 / JCM 4925 / NBRC 14057 / NRRL 8057) TaxID=1003195 RepID=F8JMK4_STREN|nr:hypothetical protein [Streptantibioticus cattleyicolor]AEW99313.1 hypothetical protein SCATT_p11200 [Streptantibioticus cattleyicolor NRRL 8057 = DSM 46488]CCB71648.1 conserved protein of unknown function [Streptantibioticus cattleyicolor NRRL 8057 = DSM 46488]
MPDPVSYRIVVPGRFNGPPDAANGGYACGLLAARCGVARPAVTLHAPVPLDRPVELRPAGPRWHAWADGEVVATVAPSGLTPQGPPFVPPEVAARAQDGFPGRSGHPFPGCFACGPDHPDGLRLSPGPVPGRAGTVACLWTPGGSGEADVPVVWSVLDCPGGWSCDLVDRPRVLARMTAVVTTPPEPGRGCVVVGRLDALHAPLATVSTALYGTDGTLLAAATAGWLPPGAP